MKELSLHILDIAQNSITAGAHCLDLTVAVEGGVLTVVIMDDGRGMTPEFLATVTDPFTTTRTTRKVGLGLPLLRMAAEQTDGTLTVTSAVGRGTSVTAVFGAEHIDCPPIGDMAGTVSLLAQGAGADLEITYTRRAEKSEFRFDTREVRAILGPDVPLSEPSVAQWVKEYVEEGEEELREGSPPQKGTH